MALAQGDGEAAQSLHEESLAIWREIGTQSDTARALQGLAEVAFTREEFGRALALLQESLALRRERKGGWEIAESLERLAMVAGAESDAERAARLFGAAQARREASGTPLPPVDRPAYERSVAAARVALGEEAFAAVWAEGRRMTLDEAIQYALDEPGVDPPSQ